MNPTVIAAIVAATATVLVGILTAYLRMREIAKSNESKIRELQQASELKAKEEAERENLRVRLRYLGPLLIAALDFHERIGMLLGELQARGNQLRDEFLHIKDQAGKRNGDFLYWCNSPGYFAVSSLYVTNVYLAQAARLRFELPLIRLTARNDRDLLVHLTAVRNALGGRYGIWEIIQDSLGEYLRRADGSVKNYREFCEMIVHPEDHRWLLRLIDFYRDVHLKETDLRRLRDEALFPLIRRLEAHLLETKEVAQAPAGATST